MLTKINNVLMSVAPNEEGASDTGSGGSSAAAATESSESNASAESSSSSDEGGENAQQSPTDTGDGFGDDFGSGFDLDEFMRYDPMKASQELNKTGEDDGEDDGDGDSTSTSSSQKTQEGKDPTKPAEGSKDKEPGQKEKENPEMELLRKQVQNLTQLLNQQQQVTQQTTQQEGGQDTSKEGEFDPQKAHEQVMKTLPAYSFKIPQDVMKKFGSEDPREIESGLQEYATGIAQVTHYQVVMQMQQQFEQLRQELLNETVTRVKQDTQHETQAKEQRSAIQKDFYGTFPELDKPELKEFVKSQAAFLAKQYGVQGWNEEFRNALGRHIKKTLGISDQGPPPGDQGNKGKGKAQTRFNSGSGAGRSKPKSENTMVDDVSDTLFG